MKQFFKFMFASMLGFILSIVIVFFIFIGIIAAAVSSLGDKEVTVAKNSILHISFDQPIRERSTPNPFDELDIIKWDAKKQPGLNDILNSLDAAKSDAKIKGIFLDVSSVQGGIATLDEIRNALIEFKKSGKFIYSYADDYSQGAYFLSSVADKIYVNPKGEITLNGLYTSLLFFKGTLEKLEIEPEIIRHGKYKSAIEPFILDKMSDENREQIAGFVNPIWNHLATQIAEARKLTVEDVKLIADSLKARTADDALQLKLVDKVAYYDEFIADLNAKLGVGKDEKPELISLGKYSKSPDAVKKEFSKDKIAVIYAIGEIGGGDGDENSIGSDKLSAAIREARLDKNVKAIVMRVNSPGGSALASEVIWREAMLAKKAKPFIVSMGNVAASGGYYISCAADTIVAEPTTITGSIGVFGILFNTSNLFKNKLGITADTYKTGPYTDLGSPFRSLTPAERNIMQESVERVYDTFTKRVADGRGMSQADVDSISQGRVWSAIDGKRIGLVDVLGGIDDAIAIAAKKANLKKYKIKSLPEQKDAMQSLMEDLSGDVKTWYMKENLGDEYKYVKAAQDILEVKGLQTRTFYSVEFN